MQIQAKSIHIIGACLVVLFGFILNNEVDARSAPRPGGKHVLENMRQEQSALRKRAFRLRSNDDEGDRKYEQAVRAVLAYAQHELEQDKRDDSYGSGSGSVDGSGAGSADDFSSLLSALFALGELESIGNSGDGSGNGQSNTGTETASRQFNQRQANKRHWRNK